VSTLDERKLAAARLWAATRFPYLASAVFATRIVALEHPGVVAVDETWRIYIDPNLVRAWTAGQIGTMLVHHVGHLLRDHAARARQLGLGREQSDRWVTAADAEINDDLVNSGLDFPIEPVTPEALGQEPHRFAEEYFRALEPVACQHDCGSGCDGAPRPWDKPGGLGRAQRQLLRCQVASEVLKHCRGLHPGTVPAGLRRWAEEVVGGRLDWRRVLRAEIRRGLAIATGMVDYSYARPSRRASVLADVILPGFIRPVPEVAVVIDTSGSMHEGLLGQALAEVEGLFRSLGPSRRRLRIISCDAAVHCVQRVTAARQIELLGGGGTNMGEGIRAASELNPRPNVVVVLTDGYTPWPSEPPKALQVVIGLLREDGPPPPRWTRSVLIRDEAASYA
jgi:predicted metal-dependent peptidase